jgi:hypothetical protein
MDDLMKNTLARIAKERGVAPPADSGDVNTAAQTQEVQQDVHQSGEQPGFFSRLISEVTGPHPAPVEGVDYGQNFNGDVLGTAATEIGNSAKEDATGAMNVDRAVVGGAAKAIFDTRDTIANIIGEPTGEDSKTAARKAIEQDYNEVTGESSTAALLGPVSQFLTGLVGASKLLEPLKVAEKGGKIAQVAYETAKGAAAGFFAMDPHMQRLSDMIQEHPALENPVTAYLASQPGDTDMEGRFKNAVEGAGLDVATAAAFTLGVKAIKLFQAGDKAGAKQALIELSHEQEGSDAAWARPPLSLEQPQGKVVEGGLVDPVTGGKVRVPKGILAKPEATVEGATPALEASATISDKNRIRVKADSFKTDLAANPGKVADDVISFPITEEVSPTAVTEKPGETPVGGQVVDSIEAAKPSTATVKPLKEAITPEEVSKVVRGTEWDLQRLEQTHWNWDEAQRQSNGAVQEPQESFPWGKIDTPEDVNLFISHVMAVKEEDLAAAKGGVLTDARVQRQVRQISSFFNSDPDIVVGWLSKIGDAGRTRVAELQAKYLVVNRMFVDARSTLEDIRWGKVERAVGMEKVRKQLNIGYQVYQSAAQQAAEYGRGLRSMRRDLKFGDYKKLLALDDDKLEQIILSSEGDPRKMKEMASPGILKLASDEAQFMMRNGLLWFWPTHVVNITGNIFMQGIRPMEKIMGSALMGSKGTAIRQQALKEYYYTASSIGDGLKASLEAMLHGDSKLAPHYTEWMDQIGATQALNPDLRNVGFRVPNSFADLGHDALMASRVIQGVPTRLLGAQDEFFKTIAYRSYVQARAAVIGENAGLAGQDLVDHVANALKKAYDTEGRAVDKDALYEAQVRVFNQELEKNTFGFALRNARSSWPALGFIFPFVKTPVNVLRYAWKYTPVLNLAQKEYRQMLSGYRGAEQQAHAIGQLATGGLIMGFFGMLAANGRITGGGPSDRVAAKALRDSGWRPYSFVWKDADGKPQYVPFGRFDPIGLPAGIAADLYNHFLGGGDEFTFQQAATASGVAIAKAIANRSFLVNINQLVDALSDPDANMEKFLGAQGSSMLPFSSAMRGYVNQDPHLRDARDLVDRILKDVPGYSEGLPPLRDWLGQPVTRQLGLLTSSSGDPVVAEHNRLAIDTGHAINVPNPKQGSLDLREVKLGDRTAYDIMQEDAANPAVPGGPSLHDELAAMINSKLYQSMEDGDRETKPSKFNTLEGIVMNHRKAALDRLIRSNPQIRLQALRKDAEAVDSFSENFTGQPGNAMEVLKAAGYKEQ